MDKKETSQNTRTSYNLKRETFKDLTPFYKNDDFYAYSTFNDEIIEKLVKLYSETFYYDEPISNFKNSIEGLTEEYSVYLKYFQDTLLLIYDYTNEKIISSNIKIHYSYFVKMKEEHKDEIEYSYWDELFDQLNTKGKLLDMKIDLSKVIFNSDVFVNPEYRGKGYSNIVNDLAFNFHPFISKKDFEYVLYESLNCISDKVSLTSGGVELNTVEYKTFKTTKGEYPFESLEEFLDKNYPKMKDTKFLRSYLSKVSDIVYKNKLK